MAATRDDLISGHVDIARRIALKLARRCPPWVARDDLVAAAMVGLIEAAERYDGARGESFVSFAEHRIRGAVLDELRRGDALPRRVRQQARKIARAIETLERGGERASEQAVADVLGVSLDDYRDALAWLPRADATALDDDRANVAVDEPAYHAHADRCELARVGDAVAQLPARERSLIAQYFFEGRTYRQIARGLEITPSRVCQLVGRAVERLRETLGEVPASEAA